MLIITVILVPLVKQQTPPSTASRIADDDQTLIRDQDAIGKLNTKQADMKAKKRSKAEMSEPRQIGRLQQAPPIAVEESMATIESELPKSAPVRSIKKELSAKDAATMEAVTMAEDKASSALQKAKPSSIMGGITSLNKQQGKTSDESNQQDLYQQMAGSAPAEELSAKQWLKKIRQLIDQNKIEQAQQELENFKQRYPNEEIDQSILTRLKQQ